LLRVMEERTIRPVGSNREIPVNVRVIAATNRDLEAEVQKGNFREDLYYRLNVVSIRMPTLRERLDDLPALARHFAATLAAEMGLTPPACSEAEIEVMKAYSWPGNVRELKNVIERCLLLNSTPSQCLAGPKTALSQTAVEERGDDGVLLEAVEKRHILKVLEMEQGNKSAAARRLGVSRKTLERKVQVWNNSH
jgi:DNA-binding NtrC family response regulator